MAVDGLDLDYVWTITCHGKYMYITTYDTIYKCVDKSGCTLSAIQALPYDFIVPPHVVAGNRCLYMYLYNCKMLYIIDSDTMTPLSCISLQHNAWDIAVSEDDRLHVATYNGVHIYTTDGTYTGQSYLDEEECQSIICISDGYMAVMPNGLILLISSDLHTIAAYKINMNLIQRVKYNPVDNTLAIVNNNSNCCELVLLPQEVFQPPFSLFSLCVSTISLYADKLPISLLPPKLYRLILNTK